MIFSSKVDLFRKFRRWQKNTKMNIKSNRKPNISLLTDIFDARRFLFKESEDLNANIANKATNNLADQRDYAE